MKFMNVLPMMLTDTGASVVDPTVWQPIIDAFNNQISVSSVIGVLAGVVGVSVGFVFMWFGVRKSTKVLMSAFKKGKLSI